MLDLVTLSHIQLLVDFLTICFTAQTLQDSLKENKAFLYNSVIMPTMTSPHNNRPHNQRYVI